MLCLDFLLSRTSEFAVPGPTTAVLRWLVTNVSEREKTLFQTATTSPWHNRQAVRYFAVTVAEWCWLQNCRCLWWRHRTFDEVVDCVVQKVATRQHTWDKTDREFPSFSVCTATRTSSYSPVGPSVFYLAYVCILWVCIALICLCVPILLCFPEQLSHLPLQLLALV